MEREYLNCLKLIQAKSWEFARYSGIEYKELFAQANLIFCETWWKFNPARETKFSSYLYSQLHFLLKLYVDKEHKIKQAEIEYFKKQQRTYNQNFAVVDLSPFQQDKQIKEVIDLLTSILNNKYPYKINRERLKKILYWKGWKQDTVQITFSKIEEILKEA